MAWINGQRASLEVDGPLNTWRSSSHASRGYCSECGSQLLLFEDDEPGIVEIAVGAVDQQGEISVDHVSYAESRPRWADKC